MRWQHLYTRYLWLHFGTMTIHSVIIVETTLTTFGFQNKGTKTHQNVQTGSFQERDLVRDGQPREARHSFGKFHDLDNALSRQLAELVP